MFARRLVGLVLLALLIAPLAAIAQEEAMKRFSLNVGAYWPSSSKTKDNLDSTWFDIAVGYRLPTAQPMWDQEVAVGYIKASGNTFGSVETDAWMIPVTYMARTRPVRETKFYYGAGGGAYFTKVKGLNSAGVPTAGADKSKTKFGLSGLVGYEFSDRVSLEGGYTAVFGKVQEQKLSGFTLSLRGMF